MSKLKVYVAGSSKEIDRVRDFMKQLLESGWFEITHDWTVSIDEAVAAGFGNNSDADVPLETRRRCANLDIDAVMLSDIVVCLAPPVSISSRGMWVELGAAITCARRDNAAVFVVGEGARASIFSDSSWISRLADDAEALEKLVAYAETGAFRRAVPGPSITELVQRNLLWAHSKGWNDKLCRVEAHTMTAYDEASFKAKDVMTGRHYTEPEAVDITGVLAKLALIHSEVSEAVEAVRDNLYTISFVEGKDGRPKPEGMVVELADALIRAFHLCGELNLPLEEAVLTKMAYNEGRPYRHGRGA